ncbi:ribose-5-phosphate isomerase RpiA [Granulicella sp. L60]|uniref:ribose-5-phosphate isomerase RpiA n=1 Tax=Granulicella sp. L60 TaxID=1641866 RepID=UPI00131A7D99|nr:ribose-5-phosphate isomerase RpiA [Granulicella sp. L60]
MSNNVINNSEAKAQMKLRAAEHVIELVESGMTVGLGSGSTAAMWVHLLGERVRDKGLRIKAVASSVASERIGQSYGIPFIELRKCDQIDLTIDGANEIAPGLALIKGGGGELLREKIVASASKRYVVVADSFKVVPKLGAFPLPVEVFPMAASIVSCALKELGFIPELRLNADGSTYVTIHANYLFDCRGLTIEDPYQMKAELDSIVGLVEHGIFLDMVNYAVIGGETGAIERRV